MHKTRRFRKSKLKPWWSAEGFENLDRWMQDICKQQLKTESHRRLRAHRTLLVCMGDHLKQQGHKLAIVNPFHVKRTKELDDNSPTASIEGEKILFKANKAEALI